MLKQKIHIIGAGPAGMIASIRLARAGYNAVVYEQHNNVGFRFNGDFQGIENWSTLEDAQIFLKQIGVEPNFTFVPHSQGSFFDSGSNRFDITSKRP
ncbi:MAG TPA: FAD-binding protein, partial [Bacteroidetes bacterium]|nr:FAD-binding protein [Bacteroidota bacterium]